MNVNAYLSNNAEPGHTMVSSGTPGNAYFKNPDHAREFQRLIYEAYPAYGYGTWCDLSASGDHTEAKWSIYGAD